MPWVLAATMWTAALGAEPLQTPVADAPDSAAVAPVWRIHDVADDDGIVAPPEPLTDCEARLRTAGIVWAEARLPVHRRGKGEGAITCGAEQVVRYRGSAEKIRWSSAPKVTCSMALALGRFEQIVQEEAARHLGRRVVRIDHIGTYACREMVAYPGWVSEHSYANAIDIAGFEFRGGAGVTVLRHYGRHDRPAPHDEARFLRAVARRSFDEAVFAVVLTPSFNRAHRNHFHLDHARYRVDGATAEPAVDLELGAAPSVLAPG